MILSFRKIFLLVGGIVILLTSIQAQGIKKYTVKVRKKVEPVTVNENAGFLLRSADLKLFKSFMIPVDLLYKKAIGKGERITKVENGKLITKSGKQYVYCNKQGMLKIFTENAETGEKIIYSLPVRPEPVIYAGKTPEGSTIDGVIALSFSFKATNGTTRFSFYTTSRYTLSYKLNNKIITHTFRGKVPLEYHKELDSLPPGTQVTISDIHFKYFNYETILKKKGTFVIEELKW